MDRKIGFMCCKLNVNTKIDFRNREAIFDHTVRGVPFPLPWWSKGNFGPITRAENYMDVHCGFLASEPANCELKWQRFRD